MPWYDSEAACLVVIIFSDLVFLFSAAGLSVAFEVSAFADYSWVPMLLMTMSGGVIISTTLRLIRRYIRMLRYADSLPPGPRSPRLRH
ncbi:hypothetical protein [Desulfonema ishimotonii]|uniref:hypothetical protein n=1 Tax=Desulfonema ishimotonii TaxID=45657 RepID=UPI000F566D1B|nr:hypothetical protein [Desulfonema ishimotonii]